MRHLLLPAVLLLSSAAWADLPPSNSWGCQNKLANAACETDDGKPGLCQPARCSRLDYSSGIPPKTIEYDCLLCVETAPAPAKKPAPVHNERTSTSGFGAAPGIALTLGAILAAWLTRGKRRTA
jgi:hypothetical protein